MNIPTQYPSGRTPDSLMDCGIGISLRIPSSSSDHIVFEFEMATWTWSSAIKLSRVKGSSDIVDQINVWLKGGNKP